MVSSDKIRQGDIIIVQLDPALGREIRKTRPCLVISPDEMNRPLKTYIVAPLTSKSKPFPSRIQLVFNEKEGAVALDQLRTVDLSRVLSIAGKVDKKTLKKVKTCLVEIFS